MAPSKSPGPRLDVYPSEELRQCIDQWHARQPGVPGRATAVRQLIERALAADGVIVEVAQTPAKAAAKRKAPN
jgi:hypothetical protein